MAQTLRIDVVLELGGASESITVQADAALLKTESGELSHNVTNQRLDDLPDLPIGPALSSNLGIRNPQTVTEFVPGGYLSAGGGPGASYRINGTPLNTPAVPIEGQDATNGFTGTSTMYQPSVDAIQEVSVQTSNYAAEYGTAGGGVYNYTMKSGTNQFHGSAYDYFVK
ncbi:MAG TPA: Plug domain-containing protein [Bryobacteraceae bacterium]